MTLKSDLKIIWHMAFAPVRGKDHAARLEAFYREQSDAYDDFRRRLLHGREEMMAALDLPPGGRMLDMGGGTGKNVEFLGPRREQLASLVVVDLCRPLLKVADERIARNGWLNVTTAHADVTTFQPEGGPVDVITFSYSLTMIPDWFGALEHALRLLKPGGIIGVVDFYVARKWPAEGRKKHSWFTRHFWPTWFATDNVFLSPDHLPWLLAHFEPVKVEERMARVPYLPLKAPYYIFLGRRRN